MNEYIDPERAGKEARNKEEPHRRPRIKNQYCPIDGHYCEQPQCDNCNYEATL